MGLTRANPQVLAHGPSTIQHTWEQHGPTDNTFFLGSHWSNLTLPCMGRAHGYMRVRLADAAPSNPPVTDTGYLRACRLGIAGTRAFPSRGALVSGGETVEWEHCQSILVT